MAGDAVTRADRLLLALAQYQQGRIDRATFLTKVHLVLDAPPDGPPVIAPPPVVEAPWWPAAEDVEHVDVTGHERPSEPANERQDARPKMTGSWVFSSKHGRGRAIFGLGRAARREAQTTH